MCVMCDVVEEGEGESHAVHSVKARQTEASTRKLPRMCS